MQSKALAGMKNKLSLEWQRLTALKAINPSVRQTELDFIEFQQLELANYISKSQLKFEAIRMVVVSN
jgi:ATP-dependent helicase HepA